MKFDNKTKELIAIGAAVSAHCQPCLKYHVAKGREVGLVEDEILAAMEVGKTVGAGASGEIEKYGKKLLKINSDINSCGCGT